MSLDKELQYYIDNQKELVKKYSGKQLVIKDQEIKGAFNTVEEAFEFSEKQGYELGTFIIQECTPGEESYTQTFHSRVIFA